MTTVRRTISARGRKINLYLSDLHKPLDKPEEIERTDRKVQEEIKKRESLKKQREEEANKLLARLNRRRCNAGGKDRRTRNLNAQKFEKICLDIIKLTLKNEFHNITIKRHPKPIRVKGYKSKVRDISLLNNPKNYENQSNIWNLIRRWYGSKIIVFDCKNYSTKIKNKEIYQLYEYLDRGEETASGKRLGSGEIGRLGIILSRNGRYDASAATALKRIKDDGYKVWILTDKDLTSMLNMYISKGSAERVFRERFTTSSGDTP